MESTKSPVREELPEAKKDSLPIKERNIFQFFITHAALGEKPENTSKEAWDNMTLSWLDKHAETISNIIDNTDNKEIRALILSGKYKEASDLVLHMLDEDQPEHALAA